MSVIESRYKSGGEWITVTTPKPSPTSTYGEWASQHRLDILAAFESDAPD